MKLVMFNTATLDAFTTVVKVRMKVESSRKVGFQRISIRSII